MKIKTEQTMPNNIIVLVIALVIVAACLAAVPYDANLANVYVRLLDGRDKIYEDIGIPPKAWTDKFGGISERTIIFGNLRQIPVTMRDIDGLKKQVTSLENQVAALAKHHETVADLEVVE